MVKVLHVLSDTNIGGAGRYLFNLIPDKNDNNMEIIVACPGGGELERELKSRNIKVFALQGGESSTNLKHIRELRKIISREKVDIVHTHASFAGRIAGKLSGCKVIMTRHGLGSQDNGSIKRTLTKLLSNLFTDHIIAISRAVKISLIESGVPGNMITIIYNGINLSKFTDVVPTLRKELGLDLNIPIIGIVARLVPEKGYEYAINAFYHVLKTYPEARLVIVGDGNLRESLKKMCIDLDIQGKVEFLGYRRQVESLISDFDVFVLPSISEGLGLALLEAMALGKPVIASEVGGIPEVVKNNSNGILVSPGNDKALAESIIKVLSNKTDSRIMGEKGQKTVLEKFSSNAMIEKTIQIYKKILVD